MGNCLCDSIPNSNNVPESTEIEALSLLKPLNHWTFCCYNYKRDAKNHNKDQQPHEYAGEQPAHNSPSSGCTWGKFEGERRAPRDVGQEAVPGRQEGQQGHPLNSVSSSWPHSDLLMLHSLQQEHPAWTVLCTQHPKPPINTAGKSSKPVNIQGKKQQDEHNDPALWGAVGSILMSRQGQELGNCQRRTGQPGQTQWRFKLSGQKEGLD